MRLATQERRRTRRGDRPLQRIAHRHRLPRFRRHAHHLPRRTQRRNRQREGVGRHRLERREMPLLHLLHLAGVVELHELHPMRIVEPRHRRVIERDVPVLPDPQAAQIHRLHPQQPRVPLNLVQRLRAVPIEVVERPRMHQLLHPLPQVPPETRRVPRRNPQVLVHVKQRHPRPVHSPQRHQPRQKRDLRIAGRQDRRRLPLPRQHLDQVLTHLARHRLRHRRLVRMDLHGKLLVSAAVDRAGHGSVRVRLRKARKVVARPFPRQVSEQPHEPQRHAPPPAAP